MIVQAVKLNDDQRKTFVDATKVSSISDPLDLQKRSRKNLVNKKVKKIYPLPAEEQRTKNKKFSPEDDDLILNHTNQYGKGEISIIELAESRNRGSVQSVRNRVNQSITNFPEKQVLSREKTIISAHDPGPLSQSFEIQIPKDNFVKQTRKRKFSSKEDTIILNHLNTFGGGQDSVIRLAEALGRSSLEGLRKRIHQLTSNQSKEEISNKDQSEENNLNFRFPSPASRKPIRKNRVYSRSDDKAIIYGVENSGDNKETFITVAQSLGVPDYRDVEIRYRKLLLSNTMVKGPFSQEEDQLMLQHIDENGQSETSLKELARILKRGSWKSVKSRLALLKSTNEYDKKKSSQFSKWTLEEDRMLIKYILSLTGNEANDIVTFESLVPSQFTDFGQMCKRSTKSCFMYWKVTILPALKTYILGLSFDNKWKLDVMLYIVSHKVERIEDLELDMLVKEIAPGQTIKSMSIFLYSIINNRNKTANGVRKRGHKSIYKVVANTLSKQSSQNPLFNKEHKTEKKRLEKIQTIVDLYLDCINS